VHFLGTPACAVPCQQATELERRLVLHFYASQGHRIPRPPPCLSTLADEVAKEVATSMGIFKGGRSGDPVNLRPNFYSLTQAISVTSSSVLPPNRVETISAATGSVTPYDIMAAHSSGDPPTYEQATFERAMHESLEAPGVRTRSLRRIAVELVHETLRSDAIEGSWEFSEDADQRIRQEFGNPDQDLGKSALCQQQSNIDDETKFERDHVRGLVPDTYQEIRPNVFERRTPLTASPISASEMLLPHGEIVPIPRRDLDEDDDVEVYEPWTNAQLSSIDAIRDQEIQRLHSSSSVADTSAPSEREPHRPFEALQRMHSSSSETDTSAAEQELRRHFGALHRVYDQVQSTGIPWDGRPVSPTDPMTDDFDVEITDRMVTSCDLMAALHEDETNRVNRGPE